MNTLPTSYGDMTAKQIVNELTYVNYAHNRKTMSAAQLASIFPKTGATMEARYSKESSL